MSESKRKQVLDAIVTALEGISSVKTVTQNYKDTWDNAPHKFPIVIVQDETTEIERFAFLSSSGYDMRAEIEVSCTCYVHDMNNSLATKRTELASLVESTLVADTALAALVFNIEPVRIETDNGSIDNYSIFDVVFKVEYLYNHASP